MTAMINALFTAFQIIIMGGFIVSAIVKVIDRAIPPAMWLDGMVDSVTFFVTVVCTMF